MKNEFWETVKSRRFLYAVLPTLLWLIFWIAVSKLLEWLIPWPLLEIVVWLAVGFGALWIMLYKWDDWIGKRLD